MSNPFKNFSVESAVKTGVGVAFGLFGILLTIAGVQDNKNLPDDEIYSPETDVEDTTTEEE